MITSSTHSRRCRKVVNAEGEPPSSLADVGCLRFAVVVSPQTSGFASPQGKRRALGNFAFCGSSTLPRDVLPLGLGEQLRPVAAQ